MTLKSTTTRRIAGLVVPVAAAALAIGCGGSDDDGPPPSSKPASLDIQVVELGKDRFRLDAPRTVKAGLVEISLTAPPGDVTHDAQLVRVEGDHTVDEAVAAVSSPGDPVPQWLIPAGGVAETDGRAAGRALQRLEPGRYFILDTDEPEGDDVKAYAQTGATAELEVIGEPGRAELPATAARITARDYTFAVSGLVAGRNDVRFENAGREPHHLLAFPFNGDATLDDVKRFFTEEGDAGPPPVDFAGVVRTATLEGGDEQLAELDLETGRYALVCFISDREGGPPHAMKGMMVEATVPPS